MFIFIFKTELKEPATQNASQGTVSQDCECHHLILTVSLPVLLSWGCLWRNLGQLTTASKKGSQCLHSTTHLCHRAKAAVAPLSGKGCYGKDHGCCGFEAPSASPATINSLILFYRVIPCFALVEILPMHTVPRKDPSAPEGRGLGGGEAWGEMRKRGWGRASRHEPGPQATCGWRSCSQCL